MASAARLQFPGVRFTPPIETVEASPRTLHLPVRPRLGKTKRHWGRWVAAAAVLLAIVGLSAPAYKAQVRYANARDVVDRHDLSVADARKRIDEAGKKVVEIRQEINARELRLVVTGPRTVQPGAPADFQVRTVDLNDKSAIANP